MSTCRRLFLQFKHFPKPQRAQSRLLTHPSHNVSITAPGMSNMGSSAAAAPAPLTCTLERSPPEVLVQEAINTSTPPFVPSENHSTKVFLRVWRRAMQRKEGRTLYRVIRAFVRSRNMQEEKVKFIETIFQELPSDLPRDFLLIITAITKNAGLLPLLPAETIRIIASASGIFSPGRRITNLHILQMVMPIIASHLQSFPAPTGPALLSYQPPRFVEMACYLVRKLLHLSQEQHALSIFRALTVTRNIPVEVTRNTDTSTKDFTFIVRSVLLRTSLHYNWPVLTRDLFLDIVRDNNLTASTKEDLASSVDRMLDCAFVNVRLCSYLLHKLHLGEGSTFIIPDNTILKFYDRACQFNQGESAASIYLFTQDVRTSARHRYPPPRGPALTWLLAHLSLETKKDYLSRGLSMAVAFEGAEVPVADRARFIALTAGNGHALMARRIWERYTVGPDREAVFGSPATMIRMIGVFSNLIQRKTAELRRSEACEPLPANAEPSASPSSDEDRKPDGVTISTLRRQLGDLKGFTEHLLQQFRRANEPIDQCEHHILTTLARALVILGRTREAFKILQILPNRNETPDIHDINVALSALSDFDPSKSATVIARMAEVGAPPSPVTFGTVIHHAVLQRRSDLVKKLIQIAQEYECTLTPRTVITLVRFAVSSDEAGEDQRDHGNLEHVLSFVRSMHSHIPSPGKIGKYCIQAALKAGNPIVAYKFWQVLVQTNVEWNSLEHQELRRMMAHSLRQHHLSKRLDRDECVVMLTQLREMREGQQMR